MSEVRLVVRDIELDWSGTIHGSDADRAIAALSTDPLTLEELEAGVARFVNAGPTARFFVNLSRGLNDEKYDAGLVVFDLVARLVVVDSTWSSPGPSGYVDFHDGQCRTDSTLRYHLADDWQFLSDGNQWQHVATRRREERAAEPLFDARAVFYGRPLLEFIARECWRVFSNRDEIAAEVRIQWVGQARKRLARESQCSPEEIEISRLTDEEITPKTWPGDERYASPYYDTLSQIHALWMLTPREDLQGSCPREFALKRRDHLTWDLQDRCEQWTTLKACPPSLAESSHAFLFGGFGTHELVEYYSLVRELLWTCWGRLTELANSTQTGQLPVGLMIGDFLALEVPRLERVRECWLDAPDIDCHGRTPRSIIARERARIPEAISGHEAMVDPDCPCCQMLSDLPGPMFWHLDGCNQDDDFAFDMKHQTREEWEAEQSRWEESNRLFNARWAERERLGVTDSNPGKEGSVWSRSFSLGDVNVPLGIRVFGLGCQLAELIVGLRGDSIRDATPPETQRQIDQLNRNFGNLRDLLQADDAALSEALIEPVARRFGEELEIVAVEHPELALLCESFNTEIQRVLEPPASEPAWDGDDMDIPF